MGIEQFPIVPISPHSDQLRLTAYNSVMYRLFRTVKFDPLNATGSANLSAIMVDALEMGKSAKDLKELTANEQTAIKAYLLNLLSLISNMICNDIVHEECPAAIPGMTAGTDNTLTIDEYETIKTELNVMGIFSIPAIEELVVSIVGHCMTLEDPDKIQEFPGSKMFFYVPFLTITEIRAIAATLLANAHLAKSYCDKIGLGTVAYSSEKIHKRRGINFRTFDWNNIWFQFFAMTGMWIQNKNATGDVIMSTSQYDQSMADNSAANWLQYKSYVYQQGKRPNAMNAIIRLFWGYHAENLLGCTEIMDKTCLGITDAYDDDDFSIAGIAVNGTDFDWITHAYALYIISLFPGIMADNTTLGCDKVIDAQPSQSTVPDFALLPPEFKLKRFGPTTGLWSNTLASMNAERMFFRNLFTGQKFKSKAGREPFKAKTAKGDEELQM